MKNLVFGGLMLFTLQLFLTFRGVEYFGRYVNPFLLFLTCIGLFVLFIKSLQPSTNLPQPKNSAFGTIAFVCGLLTVLACFPSFQQLFHKYATPVDISDVLPQLEFQYDRFHNGEMPYQNMVLPHSKPFPVYMPFHWLPIAIPRSLGIDIRWAGLFLLIPAVGLYARAVVKNKIPLLWNLLMLLLPSFALIAYLVWGGFDLAVTMETTVAAYYLVLAIGLYQKSLPLTIFGIVLCLLSRYTLIFWLPLFSILLYLHSGWKKTGLLLAVLSLSVCCFYVLPFLSKDPSIFMTGLKYHNGAAEFEWEYYAEIGTFSSGIYFAPHFNALFAGSFAHKVFLARACQASAMLLLLVGGVWYYRKQKAKINIYDFSLGMLYLYIVCFYMIGPLTYRYYMLTPLMLSCMLYASIIGYAVRYKRFHSTEVTAIVDASLV